MDVIDHVSKITSLDVSVGYRGILTTTLAASLGLVTSLQGLVSYGSSAAQNDVVRSFLTTFYDGNKNLTESAVTDLGQQYQIYLEDFVREPFCADFPGVTLKSACSDFQTSELKLIENSEWSESFQFEASEFQDSIAVINFERIAAIHPSVSCTIKLQLSLHLKTGNILNHEFLGTCI